MVCLQRQNHKYNKKIDPYKKNKMISEVSQFSMLQVASTTTVPTGKPMQVLLARMGSLN